MTVQIRRVREAEWPTLRRVRLMALREAPSAFASTYEREAVFDAAQWRRWTTTSACFVAWEGAEPVGLAAGYAENGGLAGERQLVAMWVAPGRRRTGIARALCDAVAAWARQDGARWLSLWVAEGNVGARRAYERLGFVATGETQPLPREPAVLEQQMRLGLGVPPSA